MPNRRLRLRATVLRPGGGNTGVNFTVTFTIDRSVMRVGDTAHGTYSNNAWPVCQNACLNNPACAPDGLPVFDGTAGVETSSAPTNWSSTENGSLGVGCNTYSETNSPGGIAQFCHRDTTSGTFQFTVLDPSAVPGYSWP